MVDFYQFIIVIIVIIIFRNVQIKLIHTHISFTATFQMNLG